MQRLIFLSLCIFALGTIVSAGEPCRPITCPGPDILEVYDFLDETKLDPGATTARTFSPIRSTVAVASNTVTYQDKQVSMATTSVKTILRPAEPTNSTYIGTNSEFDFCNDDGSITAQYAFLIHQPIINSNGIINIVRQSDFPYVCALHMLAAAFGTSSSLSLTVTVQDGFGVNKTFNYVVLPPFNATGVPTCPVVEVSCTRVPAALISSTNTNEGDGNLYILSFPFDPPQYIASVTIAMETTGGTLGILAMTGIGGSVPSPENPPSDAPQGPPNDTPPSDPPSDGAPQVPPADPPTDSPAATFVPSPPPRGAPTSVPVAAPLSIPAPVDQCPSPKPTAPPGYNVTCVGEQWLVLGNISIAPATVTTFVLTSSSVPTIAATGCISISSQTSAQLQIDAQTAIKIANNQTTQIVLLQSEANCVNGSFSTVSVSCSDGSNSPGCSPSCVDTNQQATTRSLTILFVSKCSNLESGRAAGPLLWWMILLIAIGGVVIIAIIIVIAAAKSKKFRRAVFPFLERRGAAAPRQEL